MQQLQIEAHAATDLMQHMLGLLWRLSLQKSLHRFALQQQTALPIGPQVAWTCTKPVSSPQRLWVGQVSDGMKQLSTTLEVPEGRKRPTEFTDMGLHL